MTTTNTQETLEDRPLIFLPIEPTDRISLYPPSFFTCRCCNNAHFIEGFLGEPLQIYDYAILDRPTENERDILIAFKHKGEHHLALMNYTKEAHQLLENLKEKFSQGFSVLLTPEQIPFNRALEEALQTSHYYYTYFRAAT